MTKDEMIAEMRRRLDERAFEGMKTKAYHSLVADIAFEVAAEHLEQLVARIEVVRSGAGGGAPGSSWGPALKPGQSAGSGDCYIAIRTGDTVTVRNADGSEEAFTAKEIKR